MSPPPPKKKRNRARKRPPDAPPLPGRDEKGRLLPGADHGFARPGRPKREVERSYLDVVLGGCSKEEWAAITRKAVEQALEGDAPARAWLAKYLIGDKIDVNVRGVVAHAAVDIGALIADPVASDLALRILERLYAGEAQSARPGMLLDSGPLPGPEAFGVPQPEAGGLHSGGAEG